MGHEHKASNNKKNMKWSIGDKIDIPFFAIYSKSSMTYKELFFDVKSLFQSYVLCGKWS